MYHSLMHRQFCSVSIRHLNDLSTFVGFVTNYKIGRELEDDMNLKEEWEHHKISLCGNALAIPGWSPLTFSLPSLPPLSIILVVLIPMYRDAQIQNHTKHKTRGNHKHPYTRERARCISPQKNIYPEQEDEKEKEKEEKEERCALLQINRGVAGIFHLFPLHLRIVSSQPIPFSSRCLVSPPVASEPNPPRLSLSLFILAPRLLFPPRERLALPFSCLLHRLDQDMCVWTHISIDA